jgi:hypothetical protein
VIPTRRATTLIPLLGLVLSTVMLAGCLTEVGGLPTYWNFQNRTETPITVTWDRENGERIQVVIIEPGGTRAVDIDKFGNSRDVCDDGELVFTDGFGVEVMRGPMTCNPWVIEAG